MDRRGIDHLVTLVVGSGREHERRAERESGRRLECTDIRAELAHARLDVEADRVRAEE